MTSEAEGEYTYLVTKRGQTTIPRDKFDDTEGRHREIVRKSGKTMNQSFQKGGNRKKEWMIANGEATASPAAAV